MKKAAKKYEAPMTSMQKREWKKAVDEVDTKSKKNPIKKKPPKSVTVPPKGKSMNPKAVKDYSKLIRKKLDKDDKKK